VCLRKFKVQQPLDFSINQLLTEYSRSSYSPLADEIRLQEDTKDDLRSRAGDDLPLINSRSNRASGYGSQLSGNGTSPYFIPEDQQSPLQLSTTTSQSIQISVTSAPHSSYFPPQSHSQNQWSSQPYATSTSLNVPTSSSYNQSENYYASDFDTEEGYRGYRSGGYDDGWHSGHGDAGIPGTGDMDDLLDDYLIDNEGGNTDFWSHEVPDEERRYGY
jgi:hypothetical protein